MSVRSTTSRLGRVTGIVAAAAGLALLPSQASAAEVSISGSSSNGCNTVTGRYGWALTNPGLDLYRTWGTATIVNHPTKCGPGWHGVLQFDDSSSADGWEILYGVGPGQKGSTSLVMNNVRDVRFRVCNIVNGKADGCGRVL
ncbi:hypothetical protein [Streptomyces sp. SID3212]|uniref:hypothetical protein n=1 Tax=unclassified Streptomyces TaxID=2593676 RepID=UPI001368C496|nr:hypothetical protein [Streptomyces sp. SID3212]MYV56700.1 hypothetical protein [Streptomyces sp. SID3212]